MTLYFGKITKIYQLSVKLANSAILKKTNKMAEKNIENEIVYLTSKSVTTIVGYLLLYAILQVSFRPIRSRHMLPNQPPIITRLEGVETIV